MPKSTSRSEKPSAKAAGRTRKTAPSPKKKTTTKATVTPKRAKKPRRAAASVAEPAIEAPQPVALEVAKSTVLAASDAPVAPGGRLPRRAVFIDVENTSSEEALVSALTHLVIDRQAQPTEVVAVGNWRVISHQVARMLAQRGARLLHSAPATGVKDWSDLSIAVHAGIWLGRSEPGDVIEIVSADRAFDAVADAATTLGVIFRRLTYGAPKRGDAVVEDDAAGRRGRRSRRGRRGRRPGEISEPRAASSPPPRAAPAVRSVEPPAEREPDLDLASPDEDRHGASHQQIIAAIARLTAKDPARGVNLDLLTNALKGEGFSRPPGSPRLVTRLRKMKDVEVSTTGMVRLAGVAAPGPAMHAPIDEQIPAGEAETEAAAEPEAAATPPKRSSPRRRSRGGARRSRGARSGAATDEAGGPELDAGAADDAVSRSA